MTREYWLFIQDIFQAIEGIDKFVGKMDFNDFIKDEKTKSAVVWKIHILGEATKNIPKTIRDKYKEVPWKYMARMRDKITHAYFGVDYEIVWKVIKERLPELKPMLRQILDDIKKGKREKKEEKEK